MGRRRLPWLVAIPLMVAGSISAHGLSYRIVVPDPSVRADLLHHTGHAYLEQLPLALGMLGALLLAALVLRVASSRGGTHRLSARVVFLLPLVAFSLQEHVERFVHDGSFPLAAALEPTFLVGLLLQLPFALAAYAIAVALLDVADRIGEHLRAPRPARPGRADLSRRLPASVQGSRPAALALGYGTRGPPSSGG